MNKKIAYLIVSIIIFGSGSLYSLSFGGSVDKADKLLNESKIDYRSGDYDQSYKKSKEAQKLLLQIENLYPVMKKLYALDHQLMVAKQLRVNTNPKTKEKYIKARSHYYKANDFINKGKANPANQEIDKGLAAIKKLIENAKIPKKLKITEVDISSVKGKFYVVQLTPTKRDCLWRIAGYDYIYNDPFKWTILYEANKKTIKNPDLIYPKQKLIIPSLQEINKLTSGK